MSERDNGPIVVDHPARVHDGIRFGLDEDRYHAAFALSSHGIKNLRRSSLDFWVRCQALNPDYEELRSKEDSEARIIGRAYDARIVEGRAAFDRRFASDLDKSDYPGAVDTREDIARAILDAGGPEYKAPSFGSKRKDELIAVLKEYDNTALIWDTVRRGHAAEHQGKTLLKPEIIRRIEIAAAMIENHPDLSKAFVGGAPQVSIFWTDRTGVPCKARLDYLKPEWIVDLKSFANQAGHPVEKATYNAVASYRYNFQAEFYFEAARAARRLARDGLVFGDAADPAFVQALASTSAPFRFLFVFQQKGPAPVALGMVMPPGGALDIARDVIADAKIKFARCWEAYGVDPWVDITDIGTFDHLGFPSYIND